MKIFKKLFFAVICFYSVSIFSVHTSETPYFIDFKYILNESDAGKKAQNFLKKKLEKIADIKKSEQEII